MKPVPGAWRSPDLTDAVCRMKWLLDACEGLQGREESPEDESYIASRKDKVYIHDCVISQRSYVSGLDCILAACNKSKSTGKEIVDSGAPTALGNVDQILAPVNHT